VVTDPYESKKDALKLKADAVTISKEDPAHNNINAVVGAQRGDVRVIRSPGEYEMGGVFVTGVAMKPPAAKKDDAAAVKSTVYAFNYEGVNVVHLGGLGFVPTQSQIDALETADVLFVPIGAGGLNAQQASEVISMIEPSIVVPMHYDGDGKTGNDSLTKFLKEMGLSNAKAQDMLKVSKGSLPEDTQVMLLEVKV
jgi:L-ascorbate metabolism protein UlaG (beta-lactamase superfamily)